MCAYDYSDGFVENMKTKAAELNVCNLEARQGDSHAQQALYPGRRFDLIFGCNLIDRLHTPQSWVKQSKVSPAAGPKVQYNIHGWTQQMSYLCY